MKSDDCATGLHHECLICGCCCHSEDPIEERDRYIEKLKACIIYMARESGNTMPPDEIVSRLLSIVEARE